MIDLKKGDIVEFDGKRYVILEPRPYGGGYDVVPATKKGEADQRFYPTAIGASGSDGITVIKRSNK